MASQNSVTFLFIGMAVILLQTFFISLIFIDNSLISGLFKFNGKIWLKEVETGTKGKLMLKALKSHRQICCFFLMHLWFIRCGVGGISQLKYRGYQLPALLGITTIQ